MSRDAFIPYAPLDTLKPFAENLWIVDGPEIRMDYCGIKLPFPTRMTVVRLADGSSAIWSAVALNEDAMAQVEAFGPPRFLIVPNAGHRTDVHVFKARYPDITVITPEGSRELVEEAAPVDSGDDVLRDACRRAKSAVAIQLRGALGAFAGLGAARDDRAGPRPARRLQRDAGGRQTFRVAHAGDESAR